VILNLRKLKRNLSVSGIICPAQEVFERLAAIRSLKKAIHFVLHPTQAAGRCQNIHE
jgi:hypothetical protein